MKSVFKWIALGTLMPVALVATLVATFLWSEVKRESQLASLTAHVRLSEVLAQPGTYDASEVFGKNTQQICARAAYVTELELQQSLSESTRGAFASAPPSEDLSWRLLTISQGKSTWFLQDEITGASLAVRAFCLELTSNTKIVVEPNTYSTSSSPRIVRFIP